VQLNVNGFQESKTGGWSLDVTPTVTVRAGGRAELSLGPEVAWVDNPWQYVTTVTALGAPRYVFGRIRQTTAALTARASYSFTPTLSLQLYAQPFISAGRYGTFRQVVNPRAPRFAERFHTYSQSELSYSDSTGTYAADLNGDGTGDVVFANPDFNVKEFRSTTVLRWEYRPGSALFVVWSQGRSLDTAGDGSFALGRDVRRLFGAPPTNVLLVKLNYWLSW
jgi:hypothetical protein